MSPARNGSCLQLQQRTKNTFDIVFIWAWMQNIFHLAHTLSHKSMKCESILTHVPFMKAGVSNDVRKWPHGNGHRCIIMLHISNTKFILSNTSFKYKMGAYNVATWWMYSPIKIQHTKRPWESDVLKHSGLLLLSFLEVQQFFLPFFTFHFLVQRLLAFFGQRKINLARHAPFPGSIFDNSQGSSILRIS